MPSVEIFSSNKPSVEEVAAAIDKVRQVMEAKKMSKKVFFDMLTGFRALQQALQRRETEAYPTVIKWLRLYLKIQATNNPKDEKLHQHFEKTVPPVVTYIIGCLQHRAKQTPFYHYQLLEMLHELLGNVRAAVMDKLANFETGIIACLWFPIDFVGDFNTQMMALRLLVMLLKSVDDAKQQHELGQIRCSQTHILREKLSSAVKVANYHAAKFENLARELLNSYNMHMAQNILVYSFRCKTLQLGDKFEFVKAANVDNFWIDLNYCPRTLTFNGRYKAKSQSHYTNCTVSFQICRMTLDDGTLQVKFHAPAVFSKKLKLDNELTLVTSARLELPVDEALRLRENNFVLEYYNKPNAGPAPVVQLESDSSSEQDEDNLTDKIGNLANKENIQPIPTQNVNRKAKTKQSSPTFVLPPNAETNNFQKSYGFLIGNSSSDTSANFKMPSVKTSIPSKSLPAVQNVIDHQLTATLAESVESPKSSRTVNATDKRQECHRAAHPIRQLRPKRRFFKTALPNSDTATSEKSVPKAPNVWKARARKRKANVGGDPPLKRKQINKVKPMSHGVLPTDTTRATEESNHGGIINITNFLDNGNESTAVFSDAQRRTILENVQHICLVSTNVTDRSAAAASTFKQQSATQPDVYENLDVSDAEPGRSYRNFATRRPSLSQPMAAKNMKRVRKTAQFKKGTDGPGTSRAANSAIAKRTRKRTTADSTLNQMDPFDGLKSDDTVAPSNAKAARLIKNHTLYSADIEIDLTSSPTVVKVEMCAATPSTASLASKENAKDAHCESDLDSVRAATAYQPRNIDEISNGLPTLAGDDKAVAVPLADIEECRHDDKVNIADNDLSPMRNLNAAANEFRDWFSPLPPNMMLVSDMAESDIESIAAKPTTSKNAGDVFDKLRSQLITDAVKTTDNEQRKQFDAAVQDACILYRDRSECDSDSVSEHSEAESDGAATEVLQPLTSTGLHTPQRSVVDKHCTTITKCQVTTTATSIITRQQRLFSQEVTVNVAVSPPMAAQAKTLDTVPEQAIESSQLNVTNGSFLEARTSTSMLTSISNAAWRDMTDTPRTLNRESSNMLADYKKGIRSELDNIREQTQNTQVDAYIKKVCDIGERLVDEVEKERLELQTFEHNIERIVRQLDWQYEAYQRKTEQFQCFKQNIEGLLQVLTSIDIKRNIESEALYITEELQNSAKKISAKQWRDFVNTSTETLLRNISNLSEL